MTIACRAAQIALVILAVLALLPRSARGEQPAEAPMIIVECCFGEISLAKLRTLGFEWNGDTKYQTGEDCFELGVTRVPLL